MGLIRYAPVKMNPILPASGHVGNWCGLVAFLAAWCATWGIDTLAL